MTLRWEYAAGQTIGARKEQEDRCEVLDTDKTLVCVLADGMGGHAAGATAARLAVDHFLAGVKGMSGHRSDDFLPALYAANDAISAHVEAHPQCEGMGCTLIGVELDHHALRWISVGDSKIFLRSKQGLAQINADHSMASRLDMAVKNGELTEEEAKNSPSRHMLLSAVTGDHISKLDYNSKGISIFPGDTVIIASDGLDTLSHGEIDAVLDQARSISIDDACHALLQAVRRKGKAHQDNTTVIIARAQAGPEQSSDDVPTRPIRVQP